VMMLAIGTPSCRASQMRQFSPTIAATARNFSSGSRGRATNAATERGTPVSLARRLV
jgi:hypothetical protein